MSEQLVYEKTGFKDLVDYQGLRARCLKDKLSTVFTFNSFSYICWHPKEIAADRD